MATHLSLNFSTLAHREGVKYCIEEGKGITHTVLWISSLYTYLGQFRRVKKDSSTTLADKVQSTKFIVFTWGNILLSITLSFFCLQILCMWMLEELSLLPSKMQFPRLLSFLVQKCQFFFTSSTAQTCFWFASLILRTWASYEAFLSFSSSSFTSLRRASSIICVFLCSSCSINWQHLALKSATASITAF